jgi:hypothetical protein
VKWPQESPLKLFLGIPEAVYLDGCELNSANALPKIHFQAVALMIPKNKRTGNTTKDNISLSFYCPSLLVQCARKPI